MTDNKDSNNPCYAIVFPNRCEKARHLPFSNIAYKNEQNLVLKKLKKTETNQKKKKFLSVSWRRKHIVHFLTYFVWAKQTKIYTPIPFCMPVFSTRHSTPFHSYFHCYLHTLHMASQCHYIKPLSSRSTPFLLFTWTLLGFYYGISETVHVVEANCTYSRRWSVKCQSHD